MDMPTSVVEPYSAEFFLDPYPTLAQLRETDPVRRVRVFGFAEAWLVTRHADAKRVLTEPVFAKSLPGQPDPFAALAGDGEDVLTLATDDPAEHARLRRLMMQGFSPRRLAGLRERAQRALDAQLAVLAGDDIVDLLPNLVYPFVFAVIGDIFGVPHDEREEFRRRLVGRRGDVAGDQMRERNRESVRRTREYLVELVARRRAEPGEDVVSGLIEAQSDDRQLSDAELFAALLLLVTASYVTSVNLINTGIWLLLRHPGQLDRLRATPDGVRWAVEECLRYESPVMSADRIAAQDVRLGDVVVPRGDRVLVSIGSANRDERVFDRADEFDIRRNPNPHLTFGHGVRHCLGAAVARIEAELVFGSLFGVFPRMSLHDVQPDWRCDGIVRGLTALPVIPGRSIRTR
jgi:cytochrome P450